MTITFSQEMRRCGKPGCRACACSPSHGPYWYAYWRDADGRVRSRYCGKQRREAACEVDRGVVVWAPTLRIGALGGLRVERGGALIRPAEWPRADARRLFALLLLHPEGLVRDEVAEAMWPGRDPQTSRAALNTSLSALRRVLHPRLLSAPALRGKEFWRLPKHEAILQLQLSDGDDVDLHAFNYGDNPDVLALDHLRDIVDLYQGDLLPEYRYEDWSHSPREAARQRWYRLSVALARRLIDNGQGSLAPHYLRAVLADDATQEEAARMLIALLSRHGHRDEARAVYDVTVRAVETEIGVPPEPPTQRLWSRLRGEGELMDDPQGSLRRRVARLDGAIHDIPPFSGAYRDRRTLCRLWAERAGALLALGETQLALSSIESGLACLESGDDPEGRARLLLSRAAIRIQQGTELPSRETAGRMTELARASGEPVLQASALRVVARGAQQAGRLDEALSSARTSVALCNGLGDAEEALRSRRLLAHILWSMGRFGEAGGLQESNLDQADAMGRPEHYAYISCGIGSAAWPRGALDAAETRLLEALAVGTRMEDQFLALSCEYHLANIWMERSRGRKGQQGQAARREAEARFQRVIDLANSQENIPMQAFGLIDLAAGSIAWGDRRAAGPLIDAARIALRGHPELVPPHIWLALASADAAYAVGDAQSAHAQLTAVLPAAVDACPASLPYAHRLAASVCAALGMVVEAATHCSQSLAWAIRNGQRNEEVQTHTVMESLALGS
jgi:DNA-binding SARP family transcriptional activator